ncbi:protein kinase [candidate division KSB1 bacterium]
MIGETISHYKILEKLGEGGMGVVYKAEDTKLKRTVALKFLAPDMTKDASAKERFIQEARAASALDHQNICHINEVNETDDGKTYIAMSYYKGETLQEKISSGPLRIDEALMIAIQVAEGLQEAHDKGIVHRDIKPSNIMITDKGQVKIMDFGLAKSGGSKITKAGSTLGTIAYMSPEQSRGEIINKRSDIWSIGVVLYEMFTGQVPFKGEYEQAIVYSILNTDHEPLTSLRTGIPIDVEKIINKCLYKDPADRYPTAEGLAVDLRRFKKETSKITTEQQDMPVSSAKEVQSSRTSQGSAFFSDLHFRRRSIAVISVIIIIAVFVFIKFIRSDNLVEIAVLPFMNSTQNVENDYLSDGITESLINKLSPLSGLFVKSKYTVSQYKGNLPDPQVAGEELSINAVIMGNINRRGEGLSVHVNLVDTDGGNNLWGESFPLMNESEIFQIVEDIVKEISNVFRLELSTKEMEQLAKRETRNIDAHRAYLHGREEWNKRSEEGLLKSLEYFDQAIQNDRNYASAFAGKADAYGLLAFYGFLPPDDAFPEAKASATQALDIDSELSEAHISLAFIRRYYDWDWNEAENEFEAAIQYNKDSETAHHWYALLLTGMGRFDEAIEHIELAQELDNFSLIISTNVGFVYYYAGKYEEAAEQFQKTLNIKPDFSVALRRLGRAYLELERYEEAIDVFEQAVASSDSAAGMLSALAHGYAVSDRKREAESILNKLLDMMDDKYVSAYDIAVVYLGIGNTDEAFVWFNKAVDERSSHLAYIKVDPRLKRIFSDARHRDLLIRMGLDK